MDSVIPYSSKRVMARLLIVAIILGYETIRSGVYSGGDKSTWLGPVTLHLGIILMVGIFCTILFVSKAYLWRPPIAITDDGIVDRRNRLGTIPWDAFQSTKLHRSYGSVTLLIKLKEPEIYVRNLPLMHRLMAKFHNLKHPTDMYIDLTELDINPETFRHRLDIHLRK